MWIIREEGSFEIKGFNLSEKSELWVTKNDNGSIKVATGSLAKEIHDALCEMAMESRPCVVLKSDKFVTNLENA
jgi:hypothetical protein